MSWKEEVVTMAQRVWTKLQGLPEASPLDLGAFFILLLFILTFIMMFVLACTYCCCAKPKHHVARVNPLHAT